MGKARNLSKLIVGNTGAIDVASSIADGSVTTTKITDANVTTSKIVDNAITSGKIADSAITSSKIADLTIATGDIANLAITTAKIADANVTSAKLENSGVTAGSYGSSSAIPSITVDAKGRVTSVSTNAVASGSVAWTSVTGRPTALSSFSNDIAAVTAATVASSIPIVAGGGDLRTTTVYKDSANSIRIGYYAYNCNCACNCNCC
jgi:hypothetical protein